MRTCLLALALLAALVPRPVYAGPQEDAARAFAEGARLYKADDYVGAIAAFTRAYALKPHHVVLCNIARAHERVADFVAAATHYARCLEDGAAAGREAPKVRALLQAAQSRIAQLLVVSPAGGGTAYVDGQVIGATPQRLPVNPGTHAVEVRRVGARPASRTVFVREGESLTVSLEPIVERPAAGTLAVATAGAPRASRAARPEPTPERAPPADVPLPVRQGLWRGWFWSGAVVTVSLAVVAAVLGVQALDLRSDYEAAPTRAGFEQTKQRRLLTNVFWGAAAVAGAATTVLFFYTDFGAAREPVALGLGVRGVF